MKTIIHKADTRGKADHGWLKVNHTFSFADYYNPERIHFGSLRVLNDDTIAPEQGFGTHPHDNMEIITIPLIGELAHKDSMGNSGVIKSGEIQVMSAGSGLQHSEFNNSKNVFLNLLQIWVFPNKKNVEPRYDQISIKDIEKENELFQIVSPNKEDDGAWIHQNAWFHMGNLKSGWKGGYTIKSKTNGVYIFIIDGQILVDDQELFKRDGFGISEVEKINISALNDSRVLIMDVPMQLT